MNRLKNFHEMKLKVNHEFDIFGQMEFYESLWDGMPSVYKDYAKTKANVLSLKEYIDSHVSEKVLTHIDAVPDNFLFVEKDGQEEIRLIDWEYAGMQDPHVDVQPELKFIVTLRPVDCCGATGVSISETWVWNLANIRCVSIGMQRNTIESFKMN